MFKTEIKEAVAIALRRGGAREHDIVSKPHTFVAGQWDDNHHVVHIINEPDDSGHRNGCDVDLILMEIVG